MISSKEQYRKLCSSEKTIPLFLTDWWLDATCGEHWDVALIFAGDEIAAAMPYHSVRRLGFHILRMPMLTGFLGPWLRYPEGQKHVSRLGYEMETLEALIAALPKFDMFRQNFHPSMGNWLPFYWKGFRQTTRYTYVVTLDNLDTVFQEFKSSVRGKIRKAVEEVSVQVDRPLEDFYTLLSKTFQRQEMENPVSFSFLSRLDTELTQRSRRRIFYAVDKQGNLHSGVYLVWDDQTAYVLMAGEDPALRKSGAGILLLWEAMQFTRGTLGITNFDFLGSMIETVEPVRRSFGARQVPYFQIRKATSFFMKLAFAVSDW